jgi:hypothetical protein
VATRLPKLVGSNVQTLGSGTLAKQKVGLVVGRIPKGVELISIHIMLRIDRGAVHTFPITPLCAIRLQTLIDVIIPAKASAWK